MLLNRGTDILQSNNVNWPPIQVPTFYAPDGTHDKWPVRRLTSIVAILFGGIHCAGWNFPFPSHAELIMWRVSSLIILVVPGIGLLADVIYEAPVICCADVVYFYHVKETIIARALLRVLFLSTPIYGLARLTLFVEAFIALRHLPPGAYAVVEWTALLLHI